MGKAVNSCIMSRVALAVLCLVAISCSASAQSGMNPSSSPVVGGTIPGPDSPLPEKLPADLLAPWLYHEWQSRVLHAQERSSIYGGFHIYVRRPLS